MKSLFITGSFCFLTLVSFSSYAVKDDCTNNLELNLKAWKTVKISETNSVGLNTNKRSHSVKELIELRKTLPDCAVLEKMKVIEQ